jgi:hypothetical protein
MGQIMSEADHFETAIKELVKLNKAASLTYEHGGSASETFAFTEAIELLGSSDETPVKFKRKYAAGSRGPFSHAQGKLITVSQLESLTASVRPYIASSNFHCSEDTDHFDDLIRAGTCELAQWPTDPLFESFSIYDQLIEKADPAICKICTALEVIGFAFVGMGSANDVAQNGIIWKLCQFLIGQHQMQVAGTTNPHDKPAKSELEKFDFVRWAQPLFKLDVEGHCVPAGKLLTYANPGIGSDIIEKVNYNNQIVAANFLVNGVVSASKKNNNDGHWGSDDRTGLHLAAFMGHQIKKRTGMSESEATELAGTLDGKTATTVEFFNAIEKFVAVCWRDSTTKNGKNAGYVADENTKRLSEVLFANFFDGEKLLHGNNLAKAWKSGVQRKIRIKSSQS